MSEAPVRVSVVVPTMNRQDLLPQALESIRELAGDDLELEVIVADNGLNGETQDIATSFGARYLPVPVPGASAARNAAMDAATGEFIAFLDDDDIWLEGHLRPQIALMRADEQLGAVVAQVQNADFSLADRGPAWPDSFDPEAATAEFFRYYPQVGATVLRRAVLLKVGKFNTKIAADEDWDWHLRLSRVTSVGFLERPVVLLRRRARADGDLEWSRLPWFFRVYFRNLVRVRDAKTGIAACSSLAHHLGEYAYFFLDVARKQLPEERKAARKNVLRAIASSPAHVGSLTVRSGEWRRIAVESIFGGHP